MIISHKAKKKIKVKVGRRWQRVRDAFLGEANVNVGSVTYIIDKNGRIKRRLPDGEKRISELAPSEEFAQSLEQGS